MTPVSTTIISVVVILGVVLKTLFGIEVTESDLETTISTILAITAGMRIWTERVRRGDINIIGLRRKPTA